MVDLPHNILPANLMEQKFTPYQTDTRWIDWGPDDYAGVTFSNTG